MAVQLSEVTPVELEFFADESKRVYFMLHVMKGDRMMASKVKLSSAEHPGVWTCFRCEVVFNQEIHLHYHKNICLYNLTNSKDLKKRQLTFQTFEYEARKSIKDDFLQGLLHFKVEKRLL